MPAFPVKKSVGINLLKGHQNSDAGAKIFTWMYMIAEIREQKLGGVWVHVLCENSAGSLRNEGKQTPESHAVLP